MLKTKFDTNECVTERFHQYKKAPLPLHKTNFDTHERVTERFHQYRNALVPLHKMKIQALARRRLIFFEIWKVSCTSEMYFWKNKLARRRRKILWFSASKIHFQLRNSSLQKSKSSKFSACGGHFPPQVEGEKTSFPPQGSGSWGGKKLLFPPQGSGSWGGKKPWIFVYPP